MASENPTTLGEIIGLQAYLGSPVYLVTMLVMGRFLRKAVGYRYVELVGVCLFYLLLSLSVSLFVWRLWSFSRLDIMLFDVINIPALIACLIVYPLTFKFLKSTWVG